MFELSPTEWVAIRLSLRVALVATLVSTPIGIAIAWLLARRNFWGKSILETIIFLPLVLPPVVTGYLLLRFAAPHGRSAEEEERLHREIDADGDVERSEEAPLVRPTL